MTTCPRVTRIRVEISEEWKQFVCPVRTRDVTDEELHHRAPLLGPAGISTGDLASRADEISVVKMVVVQILVGIVARRKADQRSPLAIVVKDTIIFAFRFTGTLRRDKEVLEAGLGFSS